MQSLHNALGQRVAKTVGGDPATAIHFIYDQNGQVIAEIDAATGQTLREYVYVNGVQIALVDDTGTAGEATYFVHNDHLGTPQKITDASQAVVWAGSYEPFGEVTETVAGIVNNIRFPGQYEDGESGLNYNYFRDYDPGLGRYVESDPIGLLQIDAELNLFTYVSSNPISFEDPRGLQISLTQFVFERARRRTIQLKETATVAIDCNRCEINCLAEAIPGVSLLSGVKIYLGAANRQAKDAATKQISKHFLRGIAIASGIGQFGITATCIWNCE